ncbi:MAG: GH25 family lysozyme [Eubacterium sp.]
MSPIKKRSFSLFLIVLILFAAGTFFISYRESFIVTQHKAENYSIKGVDVSTYQGFINWPILAKNDIVFAFIKATEGSSFEDDDFQYNFTEALKTPLMIGAYHFFSYESTGQAQADHYIKTVPLSDRCLPPVVDIEFYGQYSRFNVPDEDQTRKELSVLLEKLNAHYAKKPIIYTSSKVYNLYIADYFQDYPIWISNYSGSPSLTDKRPWTFWQYTNKGVMPGYSGYSPNIDLNVYRGTKEEFIAQFGH